MKQYNAHFEIRTCHDIRKMVGCYHCGGFGDKTAMVPIRLKRPIDYVHGRCFIDMEGMDAFLALQRETQDQLTLDDIGVEAMKKLMDKYDAMRCAL